MGGWLEPEERRGWGDHDEAFTRPFEATPQALATAWCEALLLQAGNTQ